MWLQSPRIKEEECTRASEKNCAWFQAISQAQRIASYLPTPYFSFITRPSVRHFSHLFFFFFFPHTTSIFVEKTNLLEIFFTAGEKGKTNSNWK